MTYRIFETRIWIIGAAALLQITIWATAQTVASSQRTRQEFVQELVSAAMERTHHQVTYDPGYVRLDYPGGDVPAGSGVCSDEIIRIYRSVGIDLQKEVHEDIVNEISAYPLAIWKQRKPDPNIDHRRVPNLMVFFTRRGEALPITSRADDYKAGDLVTWDLGNGSVHIGIVVEQRARLSSRRLIVHNIGAGPRMEDVLFDWKIIGHFRYFGPKAGAGSAAVSTNPISLSSRAVARNSVLFSCCASVGDFHHRRSFQTAVCSANVEKARKLEYKRSLPLLRSRT